MSHRSEKELAAVGAAWWADRFGNRAVPPSPGSAPVDAATSLLSEVPPPTADQVTAFRQHLEAEIAAALARSAGWLTVRTLYDPDRILSRALEAAGVDAEDGILFLPWNTAVEFKDQQITASSLGKPVEYI